MAGTDDEGNAQDRTIGNGNVESNNPDEGQQWYDPDFEIEYAWD
jgi:hypothetical protein